MLVNLMVLQSHIMASQGRRAARIAQDELPAARGEGFLQEKKSSDTKQIK